MYCSGVLYDNAGNRGKAKECYARMLAAAQVCPDDGASRAARMVAHNRLGVNLQGLGDAEGALKHHEAHLELADLPVFHLMSIARYYEIDVSRCVTNFEYADKILLARNPEACADIMGCLEATDPEGEGCLASGALTHASPVLPLSPVQLIIIQSPR